MTVVKLELFLCVCGEYYLGRRLRHVMYHCPRDCSSVDLEEHCWRLIGDVKHIKTIGVKE